MSDWYYAQNDEHFGPVSAAALKDMAQHGRLRRDDLIWREGMERWAPAYKVRGLFPEQAVAAASPLENGEAAGEAEETAAAIDALPLAGPEESKLHMPALDAPNASSSGAQNESNELVVFEPAPPPPPRPAERPPAKTPDSDDRREDPPAAQRHTRVDVPAAARGSIAAGAALFLQTFTWVSCLLVILGGGIVYVSALAMTADHTGRLAASGIYAAFVVASYFLARSTERLCGMMARWFSASHEAQTRRGIRERNWSRFQ